MPAQLLTDDQAAGVLGVTRADLDELVRRGRLRPSGESGRRFGAGEVEAVLNGTPARAPGRPRAAVDEAKLRDCYERDGLSQYECAAVFGISRPTLRAILRRMGVTIRVSSRGQSAGVEEDVVAAYERGSSTYRCADEFGIPQSTIKLILRRHGVAMRPAGWRPVAGIDEQDLVRAYAGERLTMAQCAARFGIGATTVAGILGRHGIPRRPRGGYRRRRAPGASGAPASEPEEQR